MAHGHQGASRSCQRTCFLASSEVAMVTEAGGDTRWSGPSQIIFPSSSLFQVLVRAGVGSARDGGEDKMQRQDPGYKLCMHGGGKLSWDGVCGGVCVLGGCFIVACVLWDASEGGGVVPGFLPCTGDVPLRGGHAHRGCELPPGEPSAFHFLEATICCLDHSSCHKPL